MKHTRKTKQAKRTVEIKCFLAKSAVSQNCKMKVIVYFGITGRPKVGKNNSTPQLRFGKIRGYSGSSTSA